MTTTEKVLLSIWPGDDVAPGWAEKELAYLLEQKQNFGKHYRQRGTKGAFGKNKPLYKPQSKWS